MEDGSVMEPMRSSEMPSPLLPVLPSLSLRCSTCQSPAERQDITHRLDASQCACGSIPPQCRHLNCQAKESLMHRRDSMHSMCSLQSENGVKDGVARSIP